MKCPGCGGELESVSAVGFDYSYRCQKCGGVWVANWVVNNLVSGKELTIAPLDSRIGAGSGSNKCPVDGLGLVGVPAGTVPEGVVVEKCHQCGWWWFPGDEIFEFVAASKAKREYLRLWEKKEWINYAWPALVLVLLLGGLSGGVWLVREQRRAEIVAAESVKELRVTQTGPGRLDIRFRTDRYVKQIEYKGINELKFKLAEVRLEGGYYVGQVGGLSPGVYVIRVLGREVSVVIH